MARECTECGVSGRGAYVVEIDGTTYCSECAPSGECHRCGCETDQLDLAGRYTCKQCRRTAGDRQGSRDADQHGLGEWSQ